MTARRPHAGAGEHEQPGYDFGGQFEFGLNLILDALAAHNGVTRL
ncbi:hypothetical protein AB0L22_13535 [Micromonospora haikouensis]